MSVSNSFKMKRSPLSTPSGSRVKQHYNWKSYDHKNRTGYGYAKSKSDSLQCSSPNGGQMHSGNDFIPLNISTPLPEQKRHNNWYNLNNRNHRNQNSGSGGFNHHYRNNYYASPKSNFNNSYSPYKLFGKPFYGQKKGYQKDAKECKQVDISNYLDMKSFLEDPWAELTKKLNKSQEVDAVE